MKLIKNAYDYDDLIVSGEQSLFGMARWKLTAKLFIKPKTYGLGFSYLKKMKLEELPNAPRCYHWSWYCFLHRQ